MHVSMYVRIVHHITSSLLSYKSVYVLSFLDYCVVYENVFALSTSHQNSHPVPRQQRTRVSGRLAGRKAALISSSLLKDDVTLVTL